MKDAQDIYRSDYCFKCLHKYDITYQQYQTMPFLLLAMCPSCRANAKVRHVTPEEREQFYDWEIK